MHELSSRFLKWLIDQLCHTDHLELLDRFHFFCNSGGVYARFSHEDKAFRKILNQRNTNGKFKDKLFHAVIVPSGKGNEYTIRPNFIDDAYIERSMIPEDDVAKIKSIMEDVARDYLEELKSEQSTK